MSARTHIPSHHSSGGSEGKATPNAIQIRIVDAESNPGETHFQNQAGPAYLAGKKPTTHTDPRGSLPPPRGAGQRKDNLLEPDTTPCCEATSPVAPVPASFVISTE